MAEHQTWLLLDRIRETQVHHGALLQELRAGQEQIAGMLAGAPSRKTGDGAVASHIFTPMMLMKPAQWLIIIIALAAMARGYDLVEVLKIISGML